jgi:hypothetical protein
MIGDNLTLREKIFAILLLLLAIGFMALDYAKMQDIREYKDALAECEHNIYLYNNNLQDIFGRPLNLTRISDNLSMISPN